MDDSVIDFEAAIAKLVEVYAAGLQEQYPGELLSLYRRIDPTVVRLRSGSDVWTVTDEITTAGRCTS